MGEFVARLRLALLDFYSLYNPSKCAAVNTVLATWRGREGELMDALEEKYGVTFFEHKWPSLRQGAGLHDPPSVTHTEPPEGTDVTERVRAMFRHYCPSRLPEAEAMIESSHGRHRALLATLVRCWGAEPQEAPVGGGASDTVDRGNGRDTVAVAREALERFYAVHAPQRADEIDAVLRRWDGAEEELLRVLTASRAEARPRRERRRKEVVGVAPGQAEAHRGEADRVIALEREVADLRALLQAQAAPRSAVSRPTPLPPEAPTPFVAPASFVRECATPYTPPVSAAETESLHAGTPAVPLVTQRVHTVDKVAAARAHLEQRVYTELLRVPASPPASVQPPPSPPETPKEEAATLTGSWADLRASLATETPPQADSPPHRASFEATVVTGVTSVSSAPRPATPPMPQASSPAAWVCVTQSRWHNVRLAPAADAPRVSRLAPGTVVVVAEQRHCGADTWVRLDDGWSLAVDQQNCYLRPLAGGGGAVESTGELSVPDDDTPSVVWPPERIPT
eukprot:Hpha_TRINITY_DN15718_c3_g1::TRINITY_DN15718_c3_g1_i1::g.41456::m.41456